MSDKQFSRSLRLLTAADYSRVFKKNQRFSDRYWTVLVHQNKDADPKLGLAIAKKRAKRAVDRNRLKRVVRESFRHHSRQLDGLELVVMNRDAAASEKISTVRRSMDALCQKIVAKHRKV